MPGIDSVSVSRELLWMVFEVNQPLFGPPVGTSRLPSGRGGAREPRLGEFEGEPAF